MATDTTVINGERTTVRRTSMTQLKPKQLRPFDTAEVKILLLENVNETAVKAFQKQGYQVSKKRKKTSANAQILTRRTLFLLGGNVQQGFGGR